ncbi:MAG TPA: hypothetical protein VF698_12870, partial [Thermoanaerobaculia bacterium]
MGVFFRNLTDGVDRPMLDGPAQQAACAWLQPPQATLQYTPASPVWTPNVDWKTIPQSLYRL